MNKLEVYSTAIDNVIQRRLKAFDLFLEELGSPEKMLKKPYATIDGAQVLYNWTVQEVDALTRVIGPDVMNKLIADKEIKLTKALEKAAGL
ncbi:MAG: hypothetical protein WC455_15525 [Dehalococcoidia bacterium]|jgi:hypothetical protein